MTALLFPGQGTQFVGMGQTIGGTFPRLVEPLIAEATTVGPELAMLLRRGPLARLARTEHAQLAVTAVNLCALAVLQAHDVTYDVVAGHSVGLLSALVAAGSLDAGAALRLAAARGALMGALPDGGGMASLQGICPEQAEDLIAEATAGTALVAVVGLVNGPTTVVVSGHQAAVDQTGARARACGARVASLSVSHAFHSPLMLPAKDRWRQVVERQEFLPPRLPIVADMTGEVVESAEDLPELLVEQLTAAVRWDYVCERLQNLGESRCVETGDSKTLRAFARPYPGLRVVSMALPPTLVHLRDQGRLPEATGDSARPVPAGAAAGSGDGNG